MTQIREVVNAQSLRVQHEAQVRAGQETEFAARLRQQAAAVPQVQFSRHASQRMEQRGVQMTSQNLADLAQAVEKARQKGSRDTVVIGPQGAFIVNVQNNVVVTTITDQEMKQNIFTNIDSAVFM
ncbi:MAG TPA: hypothetical protein H9873_07350 [Candidatus Dorea gallistercoris]|uniref:Flagellar protein n=1 Tax=Candidatus Dorea gallistercoris TaxID=2838542 RepID=A0A9D1UDR8_9FIRM|nr:hypothetical protein [Candidatus Dorea gallistercoris]